MAKRMLSLLLAVVMVLGMVPMASMTVAAEETAAPVVSVPLWHANFDEEGVTYTGMTAASVWSRYYRHACDFTIAAEEGGNHYLAVTPSADPTDSYPFDLTSKAFTAIEKIVCDAVLLTKFLVRIIKL
jgi:hypothetical protein